MRGLAVVRVPLRISFVGGGSDLPGGDGAVVGSTIDKHVYCVAMGRDDDRVYLTWRRKEIVARAEELEHEIVRAVLRFLEVETNVEILLFSHVPGVGSGLGSSSATTIAVLYACSLLLGVRPAEVSSSWLAASAARIEVEWLGRRGGPQDQVMCAFGGLTTVHTTNGRASSISSKKLSEPELFELNSRASLFRPIDPEKGRDSDSILSGFRDTEEFRLACVRLVGRFSAAVDARRYDEVGPLVREHHELKRSAFPGYWPEDVERRVAGNAGWCYKLCGAGGVGHLLVFSEPWKRAEVAATIGRAWGRRLPFRFGNYAPEVVTLEGVSP